MRAESEEDEVCWSGGANVPLISGGIKPCAQKVELRAQKGGALRCEIVGLDLCRVL